MWAQSQSLLIPLPVIVAILVIPIVMMVMMAVVALVLIVVLLFLVLLIVIILHHSVSNNKMQRERKKLMCIPRDIVDISWALRCIILLVLRVFLACPVHSHHCLLPPDVYSCCCCTMLTIGTHNPPHKQWLAVVVLGAGFLFFCQWIGGGEREAYLALSRCLGLLASHFIIPK